MPLLACCLSATSIIVTQNDIVLLAIDATFRFCKCPLMRSLKERKAQFLLTDQGIRSSLDANVFVQQHFAQFYTSRTMVSKTKSKG